MPIVNFISIKNQFPFIYDPLKDKDYISADATPEYLPQGMAVVEGNQTVFYRIKTNTNDYEEVFRLPFKLRRIEDWVYSVNDEATLFFPPVYSFFEYFKKNHIEEFILPYTAFSFSDLVKKIVKSEDIYGLLTLSKILILNRPLILARNLAETRLYLGSMASWAALPIHKIFPGRLPFLIKFDHIPYEYDPWGGFATYKGFLAIIHRLHYIPATDLESITQFAPPPPITLNFTPVKTHNCGDIYNKLSPGLSPEPGQYYYISSLCSFVEESWFNLPFDSTTPIQKKAAIFNIVHLLKDFVEGVPNLRVNICIDYMDNKTYEELYKEAQHGWKHSFCESLAFLLNRTASAILEKEVTLITPEEVDAYIDSTFVQPIIIPKETFSFYCLSS